MKGFKYKRITLSWDKSVIIIIYFESILLEKLPECPRTKKNIMIIVYKLKSKETKGSNYWIVIIRGRNDKYRIFLHYFSKAIKNYFYIHNMLYGLSK